MYHQSCRICTRILTGEEMEKHLKDYFGLCNTCRDEKLHADTLIQRLAEVEKEEVKND